jgi:hypothetical protein
MLKKGDTVFVGDYKRVQTIFTGGDYTPGTVHTLKGEWFGEITNVFDDGNEGEIVQIKRDNSEADEGFYEFGPDELEAVITGSEAETLWGLKKGTVRKACREERIRGKLSGKVWLTTLSEMEEHYGVRKEND